GELFVNGFVFVGPDKPPIKVWNNHAFNLPWNWQSKQDHNKLEVVNEKLQPVLQIEYPDDHSAIIKGVFVSQNTMHPPGKPWEVHPPPQAIVAIAGLEPYEFDDVPSKLTLTPLFQYEPFPR